MITGTMAAATHANLPFLLQLLNLHKNFPLHLQSIPPTTDRESWLQSRDNCYIGEQQQLQKTETENTPRGNEQRGQ